MNAKSTKRSCPKCGKMVAKLTRHIRAVHANRPEAIAPVDDLEEQAPSTSEREVLDDFSKWMSTPDGGKLTEKTSMTYASYMRRILLLIGGINLINTNFQRIGQGTILTDTGVSATSLKPWFCALRKFVKYLLKKQLLGIDRGRAAEMTDDINTWSKAFSRQAKEEHHHCQERDADLCPMVLQSITATLYGDSIQTVNDLLAKQPPLSKDEFETCRDYLSLRLLGENGQRIGIIINAQTTQWGMRKQGLDGSCSFRVQDHKTASTHGSSVLFCCTKLTTMIDRYVIHLDTCIMYKKGHLFPCWSGIKQHRGLVSKKFKQMSDNKDFTVTRLRKAIVTTALQQGASEREMQDLAASMNHTRKVAIRHYDVRERELLAQSTSKMIIKQLRPPPQEPNA